MEALNPHVTVLVVSDYAGGQDKAWADIRTTLGALANQDFDGSIETILVESSAVAETLPTDLSRELSGLRVELIQVSENFGSSYLLKNRGVELARADFVAVLDADCVPDTGWLRAAIEAIEARPNAAAVSGQTVYEGRTLSERALGVLSRAYIDRRGRGLTRFVSNNNVVFRRSVYLEHPLPTEGGPFAARLQSEALLRAGYQLAFEPAMRVTHDFEGWAMERDIRRNIGWATIKVRQIDPSMPQAWALRSGPLAVLLFFVGHVLESCWHVLRVGGHYDLPWYERPAAMALAFYVHALEIGGMRAAMAGRGVGPTAYR